MNFGLAPRSITSRKMPFTVGVDNRSSSNSSGMKILVLQGDDIPLDFILPQYCFPASDHSEKVVITLFHSHSRILDATTAKRLVAIEVPVVVSSNNMNSHSNSNSNSRSHSNSKRNSICIARPVLRQADLTIFSASLVYMLLLLLWYIACVWYARQ